MPTRLYHTHTFGLGHIELITYEAADYTVLQTWDSFRESLMYVTNTHSEISDTVDQFDRNYFGLI